MIDHLTEQNKKHKNYLAGGDFNKNFLDKKNSDVFAPTGLIQQIKKITRSASYKKDGKTRTSKTLIDLIFSSQYLNNRLTNPNTKQISKKFDHKMVKIDINGIISHKYIDIKVQNNTTKRPIPNEAQLKNINTEIQNLQNINNYTELIDKTTFILDKHIPRPQEGHKTVRIYRQPFFK